MTDLPERLRARRSVSKVTEDAPRLDELRELVEAAGHVADHGALRPWRLIALRGEARHRLGVALAEARGDSKPSSKPLRAPLLIAIVVSPVASKKAPAWEQEATASGVAHMLSLLLSDAGWGVMWRTGDAVRTEAVHRMHGLDVHEYPLGWLYVGGMPEHAERKKTKKPRIIDGESFLTVIDG